MFTENNNYCEVIITPQPPKMAKVLNLLYIALAVVSALMGLLMSPLLLLLIFLCLFMRKLTLAKLNYKLEYQFWGRQLDVEMITGDDKRKNIGTYHLDKLKLMAKEDDPALETARKELAGKNLRIFDLTDHNPVGTDVYIMLMDEGAEVLEVHIQPSREMLRKMWQVAFRAVRIPKELKTADAESL